MQDVSDILHVEGTFCAFNTPNHVIRCHPAAFAAGCMQVAKCNLHEKVENRLFARESLFEKSNRESLHSNAVSILCEAIASEMKLAKVNVEKLRIAGLIHDIGKIGIDEKILNKPGRLSKDEWEQLKKHPEIGWRILSSVSEYSELAQFVYHHHEKWDGSGYPNGLKGEKIPLEARIISVADAYDAMTRERSY